MRNIKNFKKKMIGLIRVIFGEDSARKIKLDPTKVEFDGKGFKPVFKSEEEKNKIIEKARKEVIDSIRRNKNTLD